MIPALGEGWVRLDPRKLLLDPIKLIGQFAFPLVIAAFGISRSNLDWTYLLLPLAIVGAIVLGALPWLTTHYRITDSQFQLRSGLLNKKNSTAPLDRVRSVDLEATLLHRVLGLQKVEIGTGVDDDRITLDAMRREDAEVLRTTLLRLGSAVAASPTSSPEGALLEATLEGPPSPVPATPEQVLARIDWSWLRFAPFSLARLVVVAGVIGLLSQFGDQLPIWDADHARSAWDWIRDFAILLVVAVLLIGALVGWILLSVGGYVLQWWDFQLTRGAGSLHLRSGLLTTKATSVEEARIRGVKLTEPVLLRAVGGAELSTLATGVEEGVTQVLPPCPKPVAVSVGGAVLEDEAPLVAPLTPHGPSARRRMWWRQERIGLLLPLATIGLVWWQDLSWWWPVVAAVVAAVLAGMVAEAAYRHLGHALATDHLVAGSGSLTRIRTALETEGIIGWVVHESWWQRRVGLATLTATTAAGSEQVDVRDVPLESALALADAATPGLLDPFLA